MGFTGLPGCWLDGEGKLARASDGCTSNEYSVNEIRNVTGLHELPAPITTIIMSPLVGLFNPRKQPHLSAPAKSQQFPRQNCSLRCNYLSHCCQNCSACLRSLFQIHYRIAVDIFLYLTPSFPPSTSEPKVGRWPGRYHFITSRFTQPKLSKDNALRVKDSVEDSSTVAAHAGC